MHEHSRRDWAFFGATDKKFKKQRLHRKRGNHCWKNADDWNDGDGIKRWMFRKNQYANAQNSSQNRKHNGGFVRGHYFFAGAQFLQQTFGHKNAVIDSQTKNKGGNNDVENVELNMEKPHNPEG